MFKLEPLLVAALAGCASPSFTQDGKAQIVYVGNETIHIRWDPQASNERAMRSRAIAFCGGRDVDLIDATTEGNLQAATWRCQPFAGNGSGM